MAEEPGHKAMLFFLEVLMNSNGPLTISQLAGRFGSRSFTADMRAASGGNEAGLKKFLLRYPSLFTVTGNMVSLYDSSSSNGSSNSSRVSTASSSSADGDVSGGPPPRSLPDVSMEMAAVQYFQNILSSKEERWMSIKSLAGHLSQASANIRDCVGPQLDFRKWLLRHPHIFEVKGDTAGLREGLASVSVGLYKSNGSCSDSNWRAGMPKTPPATRRSFGIKTPPPIRRSRSFSDKTELMNDISSDTTATTSSFSATGAINSARKKSPVTMTANEYKAVMFLKDILEKKGAIPLDSITAHFSQAAEGVRNTIGWTSAELDEFFTKHQTVFCIENEMVDVIKNAKLNVIIVGSKPQSGTGSAAPRTLENRHGKIYHVAKLWGIVDLGKHEHVFFDRSIMPHIEDLQQEFKIGEMLHFNAVLALKTSRAKWRATRVWKEAESENCPGASFTPPRNFSTSNLNGSSSSSVCNIEEEINKVIPESRHRFHSYSDASPSGAGMVPVWRQNATNAVVVAESSHMNNVSLNESMPLVNGSTAGLCPPPAGKKCDVGCQTISTGDIITTQIFKEDNS